MKTVSQIRSVLSALHIIRPNKIAVVQQLDDWMAAGAGTISEWNADGQRFKAGQVITEDHAIRFRVQEVRTVGA